jgi:hypothetical protein
MYEHGEDNHHFGDNYTWKKRVFSKTSKLIFDLSQPEKLVIPTGDKN